MEVQPKGYEGGSPVCPICGAVVKPEFRHPVWLDTVASWAFHQRRHARNQRRREQYAADPAVVRRRAMKAAAAELRAQTEATRQSNLRLTDAHARLALYALLPCRTPELVKARNGGELPAPAGRARAFHEARRLARRLGIVASPNTNPIMWRLPDVPSL